MNFCVVLGYDEFHITKDEANLINQILKKAKSKDNNEYRLVTLKDLKFHELNVEPITLHINKGKEKIPKN